MQKKEEKKIEAHFLYSFGLKKTKKEMILSRNGIQFHTIPIAEHNGYSHTQAQRRKHARDHPSTP